MSNRQEDDFASMLEAFEREQAPAARGPRVGDMIRGEIISIGADAVFVDLGGKAEGVLDRDQVADRDGAITVQVGDMIEARVVEVGGRAGAVVLRRHVARGPDAAAELQQACELGLPVEGVVAATNKGGVEVTIAGLRAFCPISQLDLRFVENPESYVGQKLQFKITKLEGGRRPNIVVSRRALLEAGAAERADELRAKFQQDEPITGTVSQLKNFGAFVDLGGVEGMIHVSELGHSRVADPSEVLSIGQRVEVKIIKFEDQAGKSPRIGLSLKALQDDPWEATAQRLMPGAVIRGTIVRLQPFGAFVEVAPAVEGLVHISELGASRRVSHPREVVAEGQEVEVTVLSVDLGNRRIALSMAAADRAAAAAEEADNIATNSPRAPRSLGSLGDLLKDVKLRK